MRSDCYRVGVCERRILLAQRREVLCAVTATALACASGAFY